VTDPLVALHSLAGAAGVHTAYRDASGRLRVASPEALLAVLHGLGVDIDHPAQAADARQSLIAERPAVEPVTVAWNGVAGSLRLPGAGSVHATLLTEGGQTLNVPVEVVPHRDGVRAHFRNAFPEGIHTLHVEHGSGKWESCIISSPLLAAPAADMRAWGAFMPLHAFGNGPRGPATYKDLEDAACRLASLGADYVGTLPLLASFLDSPFQPSPYAPASRLFWNDLFLEVDANDSANGDAPRDPLLDYAAVAAERRPCLQAEADRFFEAGGEADPRFQTFLSEHPRAEDYARFRAACNRFRGGYETWPAKARSGHLSANDFDPTDFRRHLYASWCAEASVARLATRATEGKAARLYLDLPLGVDSAGYDVWRERSLFADGIAAGAPPDALFRGGQNWGFRPLHPVALRRSRYAYFVEVLQHHMRHAGALRIDHVMSLFRLYWIPDGFPATEGVYVRYPRDELLALITLTSKRHNAVVIGEDLGTVPAEVRQMMERHGLLRMHVLQFALGSSALPRIPAGVLASLDTHDTPTLAGFWRGIDIDDQVELGLINDAQAMAARSARARLRHRVCAALGLSPDADEFLLMRGLTHHLAGSPARLVMLTLEDLWLEPMQQNVPGTTGERPNWRRRARYGLSDALRNTNVLSLLRETDAARKDKA